MKLLLALSIMALCVIVTSTAQARSQSALARSHITIYIDSTWHRQKIMGVPLSPSSRSYEHTTSMRYLKWVEHHWKKVNWQVLQRYRNPPHLNQFMCIHRYEGSWTDGGSPYYGGVQMDVGFQQHYGSWLYAKKGTADNWTPLEQIWTAEHALKSRGWWPWPNTARYCGLL